jgi:hypothetical protein
VDLRYQSPSLHPGHCGCLLVLGLDTVGRLKLDEINNAGDQVDLVPFHHSEVSNVRHRMPSKILRRNNSEATVESHTWYLLPSKFTIQVSKGAIETRPRSSYLQSDICILSSLLRKSF